MADLVLIFVTVGFFALCAGLVAGCDRIVRAGEASPAAAVTSELEATDEVAA